MLLKKVCNFFYQRQMIYDITVYAIIFLYLCYAFNKHIGLMSSKTPIINLAIDTVLYNLFIYYL